MYKKLQEINFWRTIANIVPDSLQRRVRWYQGWRPQPWITATTMESTTQQHLISSPVLSWLSSYNTNVNGDVMSRFKVKLIVQDRELFEQELSHPDLFGVIYPRSYQVSVMFPYLVYSPNLCGQKDAWEKCSFCQFPKFLQSHEVPKSLYTLSVKSSLFENSRLI